MDQHTRDRFKNRLEEMATALRAGIERKSDATAPVSLDTPIGRLTRADALQSQQLALSLRARQQQQLLRVQSALDAIGNGTYGMCRRCRDPIAIERLDVQPDAVFCVECAGAR
jgi:DnaK suppressor protein